jgi:hypothetical protein
MKKIKFSYYIVAFLLMIPIIVIISCNKDEMLLKKIIPVFSVSVNDFTELGINHNLKLDYVANNCVIDSSTSEERFDIAVLYDGGSLPYSQYSITDVYNTFDLVEEILNSNEPGLLLHNYGYFPESLITLVDSFGEIFTIAFEAHDNNNAKTPSEFNQLLTNFENHVLNDYNVELNENNNTLTGNYYALLLGACAIARSSYGYWYNAATNPESDWYPFLDKAANGDPNPLWKRIWIGIKTAGVDVWAFMTAPHCGGYQQLGDEIIYTGPYELFPCAWQHAGDASATVE